MQETQNSPKEPESQAADGRVVDMTQGAAAGRMPGVETAVSDRTSTSDMTEGASKGTMPGVEAPVKTTMEQQRSGDMTEGAATGTMPDAASA